MQLNRGQAQNEVNQGNKICICYFYENLTLHHKLLKKIYKHASTTARLGGTLLAREAASATPSFISVTLARNLTRQRKDATLTFKESPPYFWITRCCSLLHSYGGKVLPFRGITHCLLSFFLPSCTSIQVIRRKSLPFRGQDLSKDTPISSHSQSLARVVVKPTHLLQ